MNRSKLIAMMAASVFAGLLTLSAVRGLQAQKTGEIKRNILTRHDLSSVPGHEVVVSQVELAAGAREAKHTHPGELFSYVLEGTIVVNVEGQPPIMGKPGDAFFVPAETVHWGENTGEVPCKLLATLVVEKGKPLSSPAK